jgi:hypothetical protein
MSESFDAQSFDTQTKPASTRGGAVDTRMLAQVEKWMAVIREIKRENTKN